MPMMPFMGVRISWLMVARKRDLARLPASARSRASSSYFAGATALGDVAADALHFFARAGDRRYVLLLPFDPALTGVGLHQFDEAAASQIVLRVGSPRTFASENIRREGLADDLMGIDAEYPAERLVDESQPALGIAPQDHVVLAVEKIAVECLVFRDLPLQILELFDAPLDTAAKLHELCLVTAGVAAGMNERAVHGQQRQQRTQNRECVSRQKRTWQQGERYQDRACGGCGENVYGSGSCQEFGSRAPATEVGPRLGKPPEHADTPLPEACVRAPWR